MEGEAPDALRHEGPLARAHAWFVVKLRWPIVIAWIAAVVAAVVFLPSIGSSGSSSPEGLVPENAEAIAAQERSYELFGYPLLTELAVVQRDPQGLTLDAQERAVARALEVQGGADPTLPGLVFAFPVIGAQEVLPWAREDATTAVTYLFFDPDTSLGDRYEMAHRFAERYVSEPGDGGIGVTGVLPARIEQERAIRDALPIIEIATVILIGLVIGFALRSLVAPLITLLAAGVAFGVAARVVAWAGEFADLGIPRELEPLILVLLLGIVTDYSIFYLDETRRRLCAGEGRLDAARHATGRITPIVVIAGLIVIAGTATLAVGTLGFFQALGPGLALTAAVGLLVALTLIPALIAIAGPLAFRGAIRRSQAEPPAEATSGEPGILHRAARSRPLAAGVAVLCAVGLVYAALEMRETRLGATLVRGLPSDAEARRAANAAGAGITPGIISTTEVLLEAPGIGDRRDELMRLQELLLDQPGVAGIVGPRQIPQTDELSAVVAQSGEAARYAVVLDSDPFASRAISNVQSLDERLPGLLAEAGLEGVQARIGGQTSLAAETVQRSLDDFVRLAIAALLVNFLFLALYLRAIIAPLYLLAASALALGAALGLTVFISQSLLGYGEITYFVPFAAAVLLLSLGSDYNVLVVGRIWRAARTRSVPDAVAYAAPKASGSIALAGLVMAASFALLAIVPLVPFREFALVMALGVLIDSFLVRSILTPALVSAFGEFGGWPGKRLRRVDVPPADVELITDEVHLAER